MALNPQDFRDALSRWASGVTVVTTVYDGEYKGMTASSFSSISFEPPLVMVAVSKKLYTHEVLTQSGMYAVNILSTEQQMIGELFAGMHKEIEDRFGQVTVTHAVTGCPIIGGVAGWVDCEVRQMIDAGDHTIFLGEVMAAGHDEGQAALLYSARQWGRFASN